MFCCGRLERHHSSLFKPYSSTRGQCAPYTTLHLSSLGQDNHLRRESSLPSADWSGKKDLNLQYKGATFTSLCEEGVSDSTIPRSKYGGNVRI